MSRIARRRPGRRCRLFRLAAFLVTAFAVGPELRAQAQVGSFVSGERPMYLEVTPLVEGKDARIELRNVPSTAKYALLLASGAVNLIDGTPFGVPGYFGPDLAAGVIVPLDASYALDFTVPTGISGIPIRLQAYVKVKGGGRLSSMATVFGITDGTDPGTDPTIAFPLPLTTEEVLPSGHAGVDRTAQPVRLGVPLPAGYVAESNGIPQLTVLGASECQFSTLARWPDGSVKWALCEWLCDLTAGQATTAFSVDHGAGSSGGPDLASVSGTITTIDTGVLKVKFDSATSDLFFDVFRLASGSLLNLNAGNGPHYVDDQDVEWTWHETAVTIRRNGPIRAEVRVDGVFTRSAEPDDVDRVPMRFYVEAFKGGSSVRITASLRATSVDFPEHLLFRGLSFKARLKDDGPYDVRIPEASLAGVPTKVFSGPILSGEDASYFQAFAREKDLELCYDPNWSSYHPYIERYDTDDFALEGARARIAGTYFTGDSASGYWTSEREFSDPTFLELNAANGRGVLFGIEHANVAWPVELRSDGAGWFEIALFPRKDPADAHDYGLTYASAETRCFWIVAEETQSADPIADAYRFDYPVAARAEPWVYNQSEVWHWRLVTKGQIDAYCAHAGLRTPTPPVTEPVKTIFEYSNATGGNSNNWEETRRYHHWIRSGIGGAYLNSWHEAMYKADKMPWSIDDAPLSSRQKVRNSSAPVTKKDDYYNDSKHTFLQVVNDWGFGRGETYLLDSAHAFAETLVDPILSPNVQPLGNFVPGTFGAILEAALAILEIERDPTLETFVLDIAFQWSNVVFKVDNTFGVDTKELGWQAPIGTSPGSAANPDGYMITWAAGKSSDKAQYGYTTQGWTDIRQGSQAFHRVVHWLREHDPANPLIADLLGRAPDWYHYAHRSIPDDWQSLTGDLYNIDVFEGDAGNPDVDPFADPGDDIDYPDASGYALQGIVNFLLEAQPSESAYSYGVEMHRSMSKSTFDAFVNDPILNEFVWRYCVHYGLITP